MVVDKSIRSRVEKTIKENLAQFCEISLSMGEFTEFLYELFRKETHITFLSIFERKETDAEFYCGKNITVELLKKYTEEFPNDLGFDPEVRLSLKTVFDRSTEEDKAMSLHPLPSSAALTGRGYITFAKITKELTNGKLFFYKGRLIQLDPTSNQLYDIASSLQLLNE